MKILICPGNVQTAKSYPYWNEFLTLAKGYEIKKIEGMLEEQAIIDLVNWCNVWISIDTFLPHLVRRHNLKPGIVIWGKSDPLIFGYKENANLLKDRKYLRTEQFRWWFDEKHDPDVFVAPEVIFKEIQKHA
jgi:hypothetical protein